MREFNLLMMVGQLCEDAEYFDLICTRPSDGCLNQMQKKKGEG